MSGGPSDGGDEVMDEDRLPVEGSPLVGVGGKLDGLDGADLYAGLLGDDGPKVSIVAGDSQGQQGFKSAWVKVGQKDRPRVRV